MFATSHNRVRQNTSASVNQSIEDQIQQSVARCAAEGRHAIDQRLAELEQEWDVERILQTNFATVVLAGTALSLGIDRRWTLLPAVAAGFMLLQGVAEVIRCCLAIKNNHWPQRLHDVEEMETLILREAQDQARAVVAKGGTAL